MAGASDYLESNFFNHMLRNQAFTPPAALYISLHTADPLDDNSGATEVTVGEDAAYARQTIAFNAWAAGQVTSTAIITFPTVDGASAGYTVTHFGVYDALTGGNLIWSGLLGTDANPQPRALSAGNAYSFNAGAIVLQAD